MPLRVAFYVRVSKSGSNQTTKNQLKDLRSAAKRMRWNVVAIFSDEVSGAKGREERRGLDALMKAVARRDIELVAAWSVDRLGRSLQDLVSFLNELLARRIDLYLHRQGLDTTTPAGKAMFQMLGVFAEFERAIIRERIMAGLARAKAEGKKFGRPRVPYETEQRVRRFLRDGSSIHSCAKQCGVGTSVVQRIRKSLRLKAG